MLASSMKSRLHVSALFIVFAAIWAGLLLLDGAVLPPDFFRPLSSAVTVFMVLFVAFDKWLWRARFLHPWFVATPDLQGTWTGTVLSARVDPATGRKRHPISAYLVVRQSYSEIRLRLFTKESVSEMLAGEVTTSADGTHEILSIYRNVPWQPYRETSPIHLGGLRFSVEGQPPHSLRGEYWTDRQSHGEARFGRLTVSQVTSFEEGQRAASTPSHP